MQSVGQIIGEVMKQLDSDRCEFVVFFEILPLKILVTSHRQSIFWPSLRRFIPTYPSRGKAEGRDSSFTGHDDTNDNAHITS